MEVKLLTSELVKGIKALDKVKGTGGLPVLNNIKITADANGVSLIKTNIDTSIKYNLHGEIVEPGVTLFSLTSIIKKINDSYLTLTNESIFTDKKTINFANSFKPDEYPDEPMFSSEDFVFETTESELKELLVAKYATAKDKTRPILAGVCFRNSDVCAIDGFRLSLRRGRYANPKKASFVIPIDAIKIIDSVLSRNNNPIKVYCNRFYAKFVIGSIEIISKLLEGDYMRYNGLIPTDNKYHLSINKSEILEELSFINSLKAKHTIISFINDKLLLNAVSGNNNVKCEINCVYNKTQYTTNKHYIPEFSMGCSSKLLEEGIKNSPGNTVQITLDTPISPIVISGLNDSIELVLPIRLKHKDIS